MISICPAIDSRSRCLTSSRTYLPVSKTATRRKKMLRLPTQRRSKYGHFKAIFRPNSPTGPAQIQPGTISQVGLTSSIRAGERELLVAYPIFMCFVHQPRECVLLDGLHRRSHGHPGRHLQRGRRQYRITGLRRVDFGSILDWPPSSNSRIYPEQCRRNVFTKFDSA